MDVLWLCVGAVAGVMGAIGVSSVFARTRRSGLSRDVSELVKEIDDLQRDGQTSSIEGALGLEAIRLALERLGGRIRQERVRLENAAALGVSLVESSPTGVLVVDLEGRIRTVNPAFRKVIEVRPEAEGRLPIEVIDIPEVQKAVEMVLSGRPVDEIACTAGHYDLLLRPMRIDTGALLVVQDVTRFRLAERARTEFVSNVSHELRTPIATLMGYAETLAEEGKRLDPELHKMAAVIFRNAKRLRDLFEDLLELSRIEARRQELPLTEERLRPILESAVAAAADEAARRQQEFVLQCDEELRVWVNAEALTTIVRNLATNAINYTSNGGHIRVRAHRLGEEVRIDVKDDGIGIERTHHERIFERFYRVDEGRSRRVGGTGLGLAIVKHLALASSCRVTVESEVGRGSTFEVHLPTRRAIRPAPTPGRSRPA